MYRYPASCDLLSKAEDLGLNPTAVDLTALAVKHGIPLGCDPKEHVWDVYQFYLKELSAIEKKPEMQES